MDLLVVLDAGDFPHRLAQEAYRVIGRHALPLDILFMSQEEFIGSERSPNIRNPGTY